MSETRNLFHLQCAAKLKRASTDKQIKWLLKRKHRNEAILNSSETIIAFERKFFLSRRQALKIIDSIHEA